MYSLLITEYWGNAGILENDMRRLENVCKIKSEIEEKSLVYILNKFFFLDDGNSRWINPYLNDLIKRSEERRIINRQNGAKGGKATSEKRAQAKALANDIANQQQEDEQIISKNTSILESSSSSSSPSTTNLKKNYN